MAQAHTNTSSPKYNKCSTKVKLNFTCIYQKSFTKIEKIVGGDIILSYPNFSEEFIVHTGAKKLQLGGLINQNGNIVSFYSFKLTPEQINYTTT